ncbi:MAG TPA: glycosyltransferase family 2 protein [Rhabdaerophilum sp.]|nr:glycosyltransferase family 2 protein [Rhabdaerophilum sp.]
MTRRPVQFLPYSDIAGSGPRWVSTSACPWFELRLTEPVEGAWVQLKWRSGLGDPVSRPVLRCRTPDGDRDVFLPAAVFGQKKWIGRIPAGTTQVLISPCNFQGEFGFALDALDVLTELKAIGKASGRRILGASHALGAFLIGRRDDYRTLLSETLTQTPVSGFARVRKRETRAWSESGVDGLAGTPSANIVILADKPGTATIASSPLAASLQEQRMGQWSLLWPASRTAAEAGGRNRTEAADSRISRLRGEPDLAEFVRTLPDEALLAVLPADARLHVDALAMIAHAAAQAPKADLFYGDEIHVSGARPAERPLFRTAFDPLLLGHLDPCGHAAFARVRWLRRFVAEPHGSAALWLEAKAVHLPRPLAILPDGQFRTGGLQRLAPVAAPAAPVAARTLETAIVIPTRDRLDLLKSCIDSVFARTRMPFRLVVIDNDSRQKRTLDYLAQLSGDPRCIVHQVPGAFNFSRLSNIGARLVDSDVLVFLNNDTEVLGEGWLEALLRHAVQPSTGAVGAKLLYPSGKVQHSGVVLGLGGWAGHFELGMAADNPGLFGRANLAHHLSAVTGACLAVERTKFEAVGGFDAENLPVDLNDIDLCLRLDEHGYRTVLAADCLVRHHESASRGRTRESNRTYARERQYFYARWFGRLRDDPYFHPALSLYSSWPHLG